MKTKTIIAAVSLALVVASLSQAIAADTTKPAPAGQTSAGTILKQMSDTLGGARQFSFKATRAIDSGLAAKHNLQANARIDVRVKRPNHVVATSASNDNVRRIYFDGNHFTMLDTKENMYSTVALHASLDGLPAQLADTYGFVPPLADFVISNPYKDMTWRAQSISYAGKETVHGVECDRLTLSGKLADSQLWIAVSDHLPRKMTAKLKGAAGKGSLNIELSDWNLAAQIADSAFVFTPPKGAQKIPMVTQAETQAKTKN